MVVVARISRTALVFTALLMSPLLLWAFYSPSVFAALRIAVGAAVLYRLASIHVRVDHDGVVVRNFFRTVRVPVWEAEVEVGDPDPGIGLSDSGGKYDRGGRTLYVVRNSETPGRIHIGAAPRYGPEVDRIHDDLTNEIWRRRVA